MNEASDQSSVSKVIEPGLYCCSFMPCPSIGPKLFWTVQIVLVGSKSFWLGPNHFGQVQIKFFWTTFYNLDLSKIIWTRPKCFGLDQNDLVVQNHYFGPIEGQGISEFCQGCVHMRLFTLFNFLFTRLFNISFDSILIKVGKLLISLLVL